MFLTIYARWRFFQSEATWLSQGEYLSDLLCLQEQLKQEGMTEAHMTLVHKDYDHRGIRRLELVRCDEVDAVMERIHQRELQQFEAQKAQAIREAEAKRAILASCDTSALDEMF